MKTIGIYPGSWQPPTKTHFEVYKKLKSITGADTFVVTTDKNPTPIAPLNLSDKEQLWVRYGVPISHILPVRDWKHPVEIFDKFEEKLTRAIFMLNPSEVNELGVSSKNQNGNEVWVDKKNKLSYFQPYKGESSKASLLQHGYVIVKDDGSVDGKPISTRNIRQVIGSGRYTEKVKQEFFKKIFGWFDVSLYALLRSKYGMANDTSPIVDEPKQTTSLAENTLKQLIHEVMDEMVAEDFASTLSTTNDNGMNAGATGLSSTVSTPMSDARAKSDAVKQKQDLVKQKATAERDIKSLETDLKWKKDDILRKRKDEIPQKRKEIDTLNTQLSKTSTI